MTELPEPTKVTRPRPTAEWLIEAGRSTTVWTDDVIVRRYRDARFGDTISIEEFKTSSLKSVIHVTPDVAAKIAAAITAASEWDDSTTGGQDQ